MSSRGSTPGSSTDLGGLALRTPVLTASGCGGTGRELAPYLDLTSLGGFTTRTVTLDPRPGAPGPRVRDVPAGVLSATGLHNPGLQGFLATELPWLAAQGVCTVVSIGAESLAAYGELARRVGGAPGVHAVEVNLWDVDAHDAGKVLHVVRRDVPHGVGVLAKLDPGGDLLGAARSTVRNGADALVVGHGQRGLALDAATGRLVEGTVSGPAVHAAALEAVHRVHEALPDVPVVGCGGVRDGAGALAMLHAGATAVQVGTAMFLDPSAPVRIAGELADLLGELEPHPGSHPGSHPDFHPDSHAPGGTP